MKHYLSDNSYACFGLKFELCIYMTAVSASIVYIKEMTYNPRSSFVSWILHYLCMLYLKINQCLSFSCLYFINLKKKNDNLVVVICYTPKIVIFKPVNIQNGKL